MPFCACTGIPPDERALPNRPRFVLRRPIAGASTRRSTRPWCRACSTQRRGGTLSRRAARAERRTAGAGRAQRARGTGDGGRSGLEPQLEGRRPTDAEIVEPERLDLVTLPQVAAVEDDLDAPLSPRRKVRVGA